MRLIITLALALLCAPALAQISCLPVTTMTPMPLGTGSTVKEVETDSAEATTWWCQNANAGVISYQRNVFWNLKKTRAAFDWRGAFTRIKAAEDLLGAINAELAAYKAQPAAGTQDAYELDLVRYRACLALATKPYLVPILDLPTDYCGVPPSPISASTLVWLTMNSTTLKVYTNNNGKLGASIPGRYAPPNATCNSAVPPVRLGTSVYYPLAGAPLNELYLCRLVQ